MNDSAKHCNGSAADDSSGLHFIHVRPRSSKWTGTVQLMNKFLRTVFWRPPPMNMQSWMDSKTLSSTNQPASMSSK